MYSVFLVLGKHTEEHADTAQHFLSPLSFLGSGSPDAIVTTGLTEEAEADAHPEGSRSGRFQMLVTRTRETLKLFFLSFFFVSCYPKFINISFTVCGGGGQISFIFDFLPEIHRQLFEVRRQL